ncbi:sodium/proline symporter [Pseudobutyrivibrio sp. YE44]|uniref:sodium/proline symporter n=1 Tax=Pseudobutyrivibrio sp. YE44 TaxID=1520802 RepID=UPI00088A15FE|nr:sodium/proline symporter [Pseudobutyrivibrio sp. YE44]SDB35508.1 sodium/proline symporter [Pseudobutyrivibrio sp. YE44]
MNTVCIVIAILVYLAALLIMGVSFAKENNTVDDYYLGGRKLGPFVTAMSAEASDMSSWLLMGLPGVAYATGVCDVFWTALGLGIGTYLNWLLVAKRLRKYSELNNSVTVPDFFEHRFRDKSHVLMLISSIIIVVFFIPYVGSGFAACGKLFSSLFGLDYTVAMLASAAVIVGYTATGGFLAASTTDFVQSIIMTIALIAVVCFGVNSVGGFQTINTYSNSLDGYISLMGMHDFATGSYVSYGGIITVISTMAWGLGYFGMPHILLRFMAIENPEKIKLSRRISTVWVFIAMGVAIFIGVMTRTMVNVGVIDELADSERGIIAIAQKLSELGILQALLAGVILAGILACTMSTCDSQMLAASSSVSENIIHETLGVQLSEHMQMVLARVVLIVISAIGIFIARDPNSSVFGIVSFAWAGFGAAFGPIMLLALFWKRANKYGAIAGMLGGGVMIFLWKFLIKPMGGIFGIYELLPGFIVGLVLCVVVSLATPAPEKEIVEEFESVK